MLYKIKLKNAKDTVLLDDKVYNYLVKDPYLSKVDFINNLRKHSSGCAVFQKTWKKPKGGYKTETIYLHKLIAEKFHSKQKSRKNNLVGADNGNKLDCRLSNISWRSRSVASRQRKTSSKVGYTGVYQENNRYRAVISIDRKSVHIGMFPTAEEAAAAYNKMSKKLYGKDGKLNEIGKKKKAEKEPKAKLMTPPRKPKLPRAKRTTTKKKTVAKKKVAPKKKAVAKKTTKKKTVAKKKVAPKKKVAAKKTTKKKTVAKKKAAPKKKAVAKKTTKKKTVAKKKAAPKKKTAKKTTKKKATARKRK